jgi:hypothetical protein
VACFHPLEAFQLDDGKVVFTERPRGGVGLRRSLWLPCGKCVGCRSQRARAWALRCMHEASLYDFNSFVTLTYDDAHVPLSLDYSHFQLFMRYIRRAFGPVRFFMCGEYGDLNRRPHFHCILFGLTFSDGVVCGSNIKSSVSLSKCWKYGFASFGDVTFQSAGYVSRYCVKRVDGVISSIYYTRLDQSTGELVPVLPEFGRMSLKPGIGYRWFQKFWREVYVARDGVVMPGGNVSPPPRYYDKLLVEFDDIFDVVDWRYNVYSDDIAVERFARSQRFIEDCSPQRLLVRERCALAREKFRRRSL